MEPLSQARVKATLGSNRAQATKPQEERQVPSSVPDTSEAVALTSTPSTKVDGITTRTSPRGGQERIADSGVRALATETGYELTMPDGRQLALSNGKAQWLDQERGLAPKVVKGEGGRTLVSYEDEQHNTVQLDPETLIYEVLNRSKNLSQVQYPDNFHEVVAFGQTRIAGKLKSYEGHLLFNSDGREVGCEGLDEMKTDGQKLSFRLPGGGRGERSLVRPLPGSLTAPATESVPQSVVADPKRSEPMIKGALPILDDESLLATSEQPLKSEGGPNKAVGAQTFQGLKLSGGVAQEWGSALALAESMLKPKLTSPSPPGVARGLVREPLADGSGFVSTLPNGIRIVDGSVALAFDASGHPLEVSRWDKPAPPPATETSPGIAGSGDPASGTVDPLTSTLPDTPGPAVDYLLSVTTADGISYTISHDNLDLIVQSADGKVHQLVGPQGAVLTSIQDPDNGFQHLHQWDPSGKQVGSPGTRWDPQHPDRLFINGSPVGSYALPHPMLGGKAGSSGSIPPFDELQGGPLVPGPASDTLSLGSSLPASGFRPNFWTRFKAAFTGENPWDASGTGGMGSPSRAASRDYPKSYGSFGPSPNMGMTSSPVAPSQIGWPGGGMPMMGDMALMGMMFYPTPWFF